MAEFEKKLVVVLNPKIEIGLAMNALSHAMFGFGVSLKNKEEAHINRYEDAEGNIHGNISEMPIIVLSGKSGKIRNLRKQCLEKGIEFVDFLDTMSAGTYEEEYKLTKSKKDEELEYRAIIMFGSRNEVSEITKNFSLYK